MRMHTLGTDLQVAIGIWLPLPFLLVLLCQPLVAEDRLRIGVWNIEKLSTTAERGFPELRGANTLPPRTDADLQQMAAYIRDELQVDALMVTEIDANSPLSTDIRPQSEQLNRVAMEMGDNWRYFLGHTGGDLRLGLLFNTGRVRLKKLINLPAPEFPVSGRDVLDRDPFIAWISVVDDGQDKNDLILICVHLKSQQELFKDNRMAAIAKLIGDFTNPKTREMLMLPSKSEEPEAIVLGDCNDSSFRRNGFKYMFDYLKGVGFQHVRNSGEYPHTRVNGSQIDHLFASESVISHTMISGSFRVHTVPAADRKDYRQSLSDHFPVTVDLKITDDGDFTLREAFATADPTLRKQRMDALQEAAFARAVGFTAEESEFDDEEGGELIIDAEIRDDNFEDILVPARDHRSRAAAAMVPEATAPEGAPALQAAERSAVPGDRFARSDLPIVYLDQNWSPRESVEFYGLRQGSPIMRKAFFNELEQPDSTEPFRESDYLASFGFLPRRHSADNPEGYPIGFVGDQAIELNCAACHTSRLTYGGKEYWIDGSQAMTDLDRWQGELVRALQLTLADAPDVSNLLPNARVPLDQGTKFGRFARRLLGGSSPTATQVHVISTLLRRDYERRQRYNDYSDYGRRFDNHADRAAAVKHHPYGFGRLDALNAILNQASAETLGEDSNARAANAPVNYPAIWDAPQHTHVQWNGAVDNTSRFGPLGRNAGQVIGVFGIVKPEGTFVGYDTSINFDAIKRAEELVTKLWSPPWPAEFGLDESKASAGEAVYRANCVTCHAIMDRRDPRRNPRDVLVPIEEPFGPYGVLGTDDLVAKNWRDRTAKVGLLAGQTVTLPLRGSFPNSPDAIVPTREILTHVVFNTIARSFVPWRDELTIDDAPQRAMMFAEATAAETLMRYKCRPLNGVWSTAPYLHNGSVLDMVELLKEPNQRKASFRVGTTEFNPATLGFQDAGPFEFDTSLPGNSNQGHGYGTSLSDEDKVALIEFLKTL